MIEFLIACSPAIALPGEAGPPPFSSNCGPGTIEIVEEGRDVKIPTQQSTIIDWKISLPKAASTSTVLDALDDLNSTMVLSTPMEVPLE